MNGTGDEEIDFVYDDGLRRYEVKKTFEGVIPNLDRRFRETDSQWARDEIAKFVFGMDWLVLPMARWRRS